MTQILDLRKLVFPLIRGPVVYFLMLDDECVYVGSTCHLATRIGTHLKTAAKFPELAFDHVEYVVVERHEMLRIEKQFQEQLKPRFTGKMNRPDRSDEAPLQISFRAAPSLKKRILAAAQALGVDDESTLIRMILTEFLPIVEERAVQIKTKRN